MMPKNIGAVCRIVYNTKDITFEQKLVADENFCANCWEKWIMKMIYGEEEEMELVKLPRL